jgi:peptide/nickel transport system permease protein
LNPTAPAVLQGPSAGHLLGTDNLSRDLLTRLIYGARTSVEVGFASAAIATIVGALIGLVSGYFGGVIDLIMQRLVDMLLAIPGIVLLLLLVQIGPPSLKLAIIALSILGISPVARVVRSAVLGVRSEIYVDAARCLGAGDIRLMLQHVLPNVVGPIIVLFSIAIGTNILAEAGLAFLGLSAPGPSWGKMVSDGRTFLQAKPMMSLVAGGAITLTVLGFNLFGDALRDVLDPRQRGTGGGGFG